MKTKRIRVTLKEAEDNFDEICDAAILVDASL